jgi:hypothetical protein
MADQCCQMVYFQTKNYNLGTFLKVLQWKMRVGMYFLRPFRLFLWSFGIFYSLLVHLVAIWYIFPVLVCCTEKNLATLNSTSYGADTLTNCKRFFTPRRNFNKIVSVFCCFYLCLALTMDLSEFKDCTRTH